jgi:trimeric autotransporter adhesin
MIRTTNCLFHASSIFVIILLVAATPAISVSAQSQSTAQSRVTQPINEASLVTLKGNTHPLALPRYDRGPAPAAMPAERLMLILRRSPQQQSALQSYLQSLQDERSQDYRKFLTPEEFGKRYGISDSDLGKVLGWLKSHGFEVAKVNKGRTAIEFSGTVGQLQQAFHTSIHSYVIGGLQHWANASDPSIPAALAPVVGGVTSLNDFKPRPHLVKGPNGSWNPGMHRFIPDLTINVNDVPYLFVVPGDAATIYDTPNSFNTHLASGQTPYDGTGVTIGLAEDTDVDSDGILNYRSFFGLAENGHWSTVYDGSFSNLDQSADQTEALLDSEVVGGLAPGANVIMYTAGDTVFQSGLFLAIYRAIDDNNVGILSVSYGGCEADQGAAGNLQILNTWEQAAAQGIAVTVSTGDSGSAGCDDPDTETVATQGLAVNGIASTPYNIAVGGTDFDGLQGSFSTYVDSTNGANYTTALSYIPENPWNDSTSKNGLLAANSAYKDSSGITNIVAGGGGASSLGSVEANGSQTGYSKPPWQQSFAASNTGAFRDLPDVSLLAGNGQYGAMWALCSNNSTDCTGPNPTISGVGGTSASAPAFAAILALVNQKIGVSTRLGQANWVLYRLAQTYPGVFHQIATGNNSVFCTAGSSNCGGNDFLSGYNAASGYNLATGLGSVDATKLVNDWADVSLAPTTTTLSLNKTTFVHGTNVNIGVGVDPSSATGNVAIVNYASSQIPAIASIPQTSLAISGGSASGSTTQFPGGAYSVFANYGGDGSYSGSTSSGVPVTVSPEASVLNLTVDTINSNSTLVSAAGATLPLGTLVTVNAQPIGVSQASRPNPATNATGSVFLWDSPTGTGGPEIGDDANLDSTGNEEVNLYFAAGPHGVNGSYSGDLSYGSSTAGPVNFTVSQATTTLSLSESASTTDNGAVYLNGQITSTVPPNSYPMYGTITYTDTTSNVVLGTGSPFDGVPCKNATTFCVSAPLQIWASQIILGANTITASYSGDSNFLAAGPSAPVTVNCSVGCTNLLGQTIGINFYQLSASSIAAGSSITAQVDVDGNGGFTGAVNLTCSVAGSSSAYVDIPTCSYAANQLTITGSQAVGTTITVTTTAPTSGALHYPRHSDPSRDRWCAASGLVLSALLLFGIPARRFRNRYLLGLFAVFLMMGSITACGGGGSTGGGGGGQSGTSAGTYTVTLKAVDAATSTLIATDYFTFTVN